MAPTLTDVYGTTYLFPSPCEDLLPALNEDVGGIGVSDHLLQCLHFVTDADEEQSYIAYYMQMALVIASFLLIRIFSSWTFWLISSLRLLRFGKFKPRALQRSLHQHINPLTTALVDFHKAQCYFMIAVHAAAIALIATPTSLDATSYLQLGANYQFLAMISTGGILPVVITLVEINRLNRRSSYILGLSVATSILAPIVSISASMPSEPWTVLSPGVGTSVACGGVYVYKFCSTNYLFQKNKHHNSSSWTVMLLIFAVVVYVVLIAERLVHLLGYVSTRMKSKPKASNDGTKPQTQATWVFRTTLYLSILCIHYSACIYFTYKYLHQLATFSSYASISHKWTFGQIVSVTIWFAPIFEYIYLEIRGMQKGHKYKLHEPYVVVNTDEDLERQRKQVSKSRMADFWLRPVSTALGIDLNPKRKGSDDGLRSSGDEGSGSEEEPVTDAITKDEGDVVEGIQRRRTA